MTNAMEVTAVSGGRLGARLSARRPSLHARARGLVAAMALASAGVHAACPPAGYDTATLDRLRESGFRMEGETERDRFALELLDCTGDPDPMLRDGLAFEALQAWLRGRELGDDTLRALHAGLSEQLADPEDARGFRLAFAALILSEVARADRIEPFLAHEARESTVELAANWLEGVRDYRGFSDREGWRHAIAHGADLALQLALNEKLDAAAVRRLMDAVASQIAPQGVVHYVHGESERLARAVHFALHRGVLPADYWDAWIRRLADPAPLPSWSEAYRSEAGLARRHNTMAFLQALHFAALSAGDGEGVAVADACMAGMRRLHGG